MEKSGLRLIHDNFDNKEGILIFTDIHPPILPMAKELYSQATTQTQKINFIAEYLGLV